MSLLEEFSAEFEDLKDNADYGFGAGQEFVAKILSLLPKKRFELESLLRAIEEDSFSRGINLPNLDLRSYLKEKEEWVASNGSSLKKKASLIVDTFDPTLFHVSDKYKALFANAKGSFILKFLDSSSKCNFS